MRSDNNKSQNNSNNNKSSNAVDSSSAKSGGMLLAERKSEGKGKINSKSLTDFVSDSYVYAKDSIVTASDEASKKFTTLKEKLPSSVKQGLGSHSSSSTVPTSSTTNSTSTGNNGASANPRVFLYHLNGGFIVREKGVPRYCHTGSPSTFTIIPIDENNNEVHDPRMGCLTDVNNRVEEYIDLLKSYNRVAIQDEHGNFISCGTYLPAFKSAQAWYKEELGTSEIFSIESCVTNGTTFSFKSHNGLYLHYNHHLGTIAFKTREPNYASWHVHPLNLAVSDSSSDEEVSSKQFTTLKGKLPSSVKQGLGSHSSSSTVPTSSTTNSTSTGNNGASANPRVFLYHLNGGFIVREKGVPRYCHTGSPSTFTIIPIDENNNEVHDPRMGCLTDVNNRVEEYIDLLKSYNRVAIQDEHGNFISCGTYLPAFKSAQAWYKEELGTSEIFSIESCVTNGTTFSFKSHNGLYLHYNHHLGTIAFKTREPNYASWHVHPLNLAVSDSSEQIIFVGVLNQEKQFLIQRTAAGFLPDEWKVDLDIVLGLFSSKLEEGSSTISQHPVTKHQWCVTRTSENCMHLVITSENFPKSIATGCSDDLEEIYDQYLDEGKDERLISNNINKDQHFSNLLRGLMHEYDDTYSCSKFAVANDQVKATMAKMAENIANMQENIACAEEMKETTDELLEFASNFKKQSSDLKYTMWKKAAIASGIVIGGASGATVGFLVGGPGGAAILGAEVAEIAVGAGLGILAGGSTAVTCSSRFWKRRFVSLGKMMMF